MWPLLLLGLLLTQGEPEIPPPPPLPLHVETESDDSPIESLRLFGERLSMALIGLCPVQPLDSNGFADQSSPPLETGISPVLERWAAFNRPAPRNRVKFNRYVWTHPLTIERRSEGEIVWENDSMRLDLRPPRDFPKSGVKTNRQDRFGRTYKVAAEPAAVSIVVRGESLLFIDHTHRTFTRLELPTQWVTRSQFDAASPFHEFQVADRVRTFSVSPGEKHDPQQRAHLKLQGLWKAWQQEYSGVEVMLDVTSGRPLAMRTVDPAAVRETVYVYEEVQRGGVNDLWSVNPFQLDLTGYVQIGASVTH